MGTDTRPVRDRESIADKSLSRRSVAVPIDFIVNAKGSPGCSIKPAL